jgi:hypothetical protein
MEGPTGPLEPFAAQPEGEQLEQKAGELTKRQPFWRKLFKSSPQ